MIGNKNSARGVQHLRGAVPAGGLPAGVTVQADDAGDIHLIAGPHYRGVQFHAESILTQRGFDILADVVSALLPG